MALSVAHFLRIYRIKEAMMNDGITKPNIEGRELISTLVERLSILDPELPCDLRKSVNKDGSMRYAFTVNGEELAVTSFPHEAL